MNKTLVFDGGMGTMLQASGLSASENPSVFGMNHPDVVENIHSQYIEAGSNVILTNTFSANAYKLENCAASTQEVISSNVKTAVKAARGAKVALDIGPIGKLMEPFGEMTFEKAYDIFKEIIIAGEKAGADYIYFETMTDLTELKAGILAAKENSKLPIFATMSFEESGKTFLGVDIKSMAVTLTALGVSALGINCSLGPKQMLPFVRELKQYTHLPIIIKPNAGLPDPKTGEYNLSAHDFALEMEDVINEGVFAVGGCCGTTPKYIAKLSKKVEQCGKTDIKKDTFEKTDAVCSPQKIVLLDGPKVVGERINPTGKKLLQNALKEKNYDYIKQIAIREEEEGADVLDINVGALSIDEESAMKEVVKAVSSVVDIPLQIDSSNPAAIEAGLRNYPGRMIVNSVDASDEKLQKILPLVKKYGAKVIGLTMDENGIPEDAGRRIFLAKKIIKQAENFGISKEDIIIDALTLTIATNPKSAKQTLDVIRELTKEGIKTTLGISNISFGLFERESINASFLKAAIDAGLTLPIINPGCSQMMKIAKGESTDDIIDFEEIVKLAIAGDFEKMKVLCKAASENDTQIKQEMSAANLDIKSAIKNGLFDETAKQVSSLLEKMDELSIINEKIVPALDEIGKEYEEGKIFLPSLIGAANAAKSGFEEIRKSLAKKNIEDNSKGSIVLATVKGDIHDIGKNIAKAILENYGYKVVDLGKDVSEEKIVDAIKSTKTKLVGLSALMTTTATSMRDTIKKIREEKLDVKIMVGGAVITKEYAMQIGADYYVKDVLDDVGAAREVYNQ